MTMTHGVVLGGGVAGLLAAAVLAGRMDTVTVIERDRFDETRRKGAPQARHAHLLLARGAMAVDEIVPGATRALLAAGARKLMMPRDVLTFTPYGWLPRFDHDLFLISCRRALIESVLRAEVLGGVAVREGRDAVGLLGDGAGVTGVRVRDRSTGSVAPLAADLVVDATGSGSPSGQWLAELGRRPPRETVVDAGIRYATRLYRPQAELAAAMPAVCVQPDPVRGDAHGGVVLPIEEDLWIVSLTGMRGHEPPVDEVGFAAFARGLRHPLVADLIESAEPVGPIRGYAAPPNRMRRFGTVPGFVAIGDAACSFNPLYGHGMTIAALGALALRDGGGQREVDKVAGDAWALATGMDMRHSATTATAGMPSGGVRAAFGDMVGAAAAVDPRVAATLLESYTLRAPMSRLLRPRSLLDVLRARRTPRPDDRAPISHGEAGLIRAGRR